MPPEDQNNPQNTVPQNAQFGQVPAAVPPQNIPFTQNPSPEQTEQPQQKSSKKKIIIFALIILIVIAALAAIAYFLLVVKANPFAKVLGIKPAPSPASQISTSDQSPKSIVSTPSPAGQTQSPMPQNQTSPLSDFENNLKSGDFVVSVSGNVQATDAKGAVIGTDLLDGTKFYLKKGEVVRADSRTAPPNTLPDYTLIVENGKFYYVNPNQKAISSVDIQSQNSQNSEYVHFKQAFPLSQLVDDDAKDALKWTKVSENVYQAQWNYLFAYNSVATVNPLPTTVQITLDPTYHSLSAVGIKFSSKSPWQTLNFKFDAVSGIDTLLTIPTGYQEIAFPVLK